MSTTVNAQSHPPTTPGAEGPPSTALKRVIAASLTGTALEWYDFFIYGTAAALVFDELFFPGAKPGIGTLAAFATFGLGFMFRPLGGIVFGHLGDRIGRRETLIITTLVMGLATGVIGLLPTYATIGIWAPVGLILLRICQGMGAGAEFGGASTLLAEHAPARRRGFYASFSQAGVQTGLVLATVAFLIVGTLPDDQLQSWGWRIPFLVSFAMIAVTLYVRMRVEESPVFREIERTRRVESRPFLEAFKRYPRSVLVGIGAHIVDTAVIYVYATYSVAYVTKELDFSRTTALTGIVIAGVVVTLMQPVYGAISDRIGRKPLNLWSTIFTGLWAFPFFALLNTGEPALAWLAVFVGLGPMIAIQGAFNAELFGARVRYSGFAFSREMGAAIAGFSPTIATALAGALDGAPWLVAGFMIVSALISLVAFLASVETKDVDIGDFDPEQERIVSALTLAEEPRFTKDGALAASARR
jgi:MHS family shikimate/dehydroshikimate transporter-like MFS transporter